MSGVTWRYDNYISSIFPGKKPLYDYADKSGNVSAIIGYMLNRTQSMFVWRGLPESIPARSLELYLQITGNAGIIEHNGKLYAVTGGMGGEPDPYYMPTLYTVANPALNLSHSYKIGVDCVVIPNDAMYMGLMPMYNRFAAGITESELSLWIALINARLVDLIEALDDRTKDAALTMLKDVVDGKLAVIGSKSLAGAIKAFPYAQANNRVLTDLIETIQYLKASWYNELGLNANYNMKRESINSGESQLNNDALLPLVDNMLDMRRKGAEAVNRMWGTDITVDYASAWKDNMEEIAAEQGKLEERGAEDAEATVE